ncbi:MAG: arsenate reductase ArsC [Acidobacteria bacterium]|nr:arsenate reductase ArsC [Acidobacteriota bacterium]
MVTVVFACVHNAGRSQMAAAFFNAAADPVKARAISAGTQPADRVHPLVADAMQEVGIDVSGATPQLLTPTIAAHAQWLITMGCGDECPVVPGVARDDWALVDPAHQPIELVRTIRDEIRRRVQRFVYSHDLARGL